MNDYGPNVSKFPDLVKALRYQLAKNGGCTSCKKNALIRKYDGIAKRRLQKEALSGKKKV